jgi:hypothetical protein
MAGLVTGLRQALIIKNCPCKKRKKEVKLKLKRTVSRDIWVQLRQPEHQLEYETAPLLKV